jgi:arylsulfatase A-like enzyme
LRRAHRFLGFVVLAAAAAAATSCDRSPAGSSTPPAQPVASQVPAASNPVRPGPLVLVGVDGLEWRLVLDLVARGRLPQLQSMIENGSSARLTTLQPALSPPIWTSIATGVVPQRHGILGFVQGDAADPAAQGRLFNSRDRRVRAIWDMTAERGLSSCVVGWWMTYPVDPLRGVMVAQTGAAPGLERERTRKGGLEPGKSGQVYPSDLEEHFFAIARSSASRIPAVEQQLYGDFSSWPPAMQQVAVHSRWSLAADAAYEDIALDLLSSPHRCDVVLVYLGIADVLGHRLWRWTSPGDFSSPPPAAEIERYGDVLARAYESIDRFVGRVREAAGPGATILVASDHGMGAFRPAGPVDLERTDGPLIRTGGHSAGRDAFLAAIGPGIAGRTAAVHPARIDDVARSGSVLDLAPTLLALLALPRGADMDGHVLTSMLDPAFLAAHPLSEIPTWTDPAWTAARRPYRTSAGEDAERVDELRSLGYLQ